MDTGLAPSEFDWVPVSPRLASMRKFYVVLTAAGPIVLGVVLTFLVPWWIGVLIAVATAALAAWAWVLVGRNQQSWRYAEREDDLLISHGVMFRRLVIVPYGRMQLVDVTVGPVERYFGIRKVQLHTASAGSDARIVGLPPAEADRLRDRLASRGEAQSAGL